MSRNLEEEFDALRNEVRALAEIVRQLGHGTKSQTSRSNLMIEQTKGDKAPRAYELREQYPDENSFVSYYGFFETDGQGFFWDINRSGEVLLGLDDEKVAKVLTALASKQRLAILKSILKKPGSALDLVERLNLGTTGQVYHHLKALLSADLVMQEERGLYCFKGHRVSGLLMLLAGVVGLLDERYSSGTWEDEIEVNQ
jgi:DNA gyrase subunit B